MKIIPILGVSCMLVAGCSDNANSPRGFSLPEGDIANGKQVLLKYQCTDCHQVEGIEVSDSHNYLLSEPVKLGGTSARIKTYGELVTSIINPSHKLSPRLPVSLTSDNGQSKMPTINNQLTVSELIDLTAYLQTKYKVEPYRMSEYRLYRLRSVSDADQSSDD